MTLKLSNVNYDTDEDEEDIEAAIHQLKPGELLLPRPSSSFFTYSSDREEEWNKLLESYRRVVGEVLSYIDEEDEDEDEESSGGIVIEPGPSELVVIRGGAGVGKSFLVKRLKLTQAVHGAEVSSGGLFIQGHFDRSGANNNSDSSSTKKKKMDGGRPYAAFVDALDTLCDIVLRNGNEKEFKAHIEEVVGRGLKERDLLVTLVPKLALILGGSNKRRQRTTTTSMMSNNSKGLQFVFRKFMRALGRYSHRIQGGPLVLSLEDAECIDNASLELLKCICTDGRRSKGVLIILSVRDERIDLPFLLPPPQEEGDEEGTEEERIPGDQAQEETKHEEEAQEETKTEEEDQEETKHEEEDQEETNEAQEDTQEEETTNTPNEPPKTPLQKTLHEIQQSSTSSSTTTSTTHMPLSEISISNLDEATLSTLLSTVLRQEQRSLASLSTLIHRKTLGNPLYTIQFIQSLVQEKLLEYSFMSFTWKWDIQKIQAETNVTDNVVNVYLMNTISRLEDTVKFVLMIASCLYSTTVLDSNVLTRIALAVVQGSPPQHNYPNDVTEESILNALDVAIQEGLMERVSTTVVGTKVKFSHDRVKTGCASTLIPLMGQTSENVEEDNGEDMKLRLHLNIGNALREIYNEESGGGDDDEEEGMSGQSWMLFSAVDHLNIAAEKQQASSSSSLNREDVDLIELANLNLEAGLKAISLAAFVPASDYLSKGLQMLQHSSSSSQNCWTSNNYDLSLQLHTELSSTLYCCGRMEECHDISNQVLTHAKTLQEKFRCYLNIIALLKAGGKIEESVEVGIEFLNLLGEPFLLKPSKWKLKSEAKAVKKLLSKYDDTQLLNLPDCTDECKSMAVYVLGMLFGPMVHLNHQGALEYLRLHSVRLTVENGICDASALAYAYYGSYLISSKNVDLNGGHRFGKLALKLVEDERREGGAELKARTILLSNFMIVHWKEPLPKTLDKLMDGYSVGMLNGDIEMAFTCAGIYQQHYYYCGLSLQSGEKDIREFCAQMKEYKQNKELRTAQPLWQSMLNLMGESSHPTTLTGDAMDQDEFESGGKIGGVVMTSYRMQLAYYFDDLSLAELCMDTLRPQSGGFTAPFFQVARRFFFALIYLGLARKADNKKVVKGYLKQAKEDIEWLKERVQKGGINCLHKLMILEAELKSFSKQKDIRQQYDKAIMTANRNGFMQDHALANELAGVYCLESNDLYWATFYLERASATYNDWGAYGKVDQLRVKYPHILDKNNHNDDGNDRRGSGGSKGSGIGKRGIVLKSGSNYMGRRRFSSRLSDSHKSLTASFRSSGST